MKLFCHAILVCVAGMVLCSPVSGVMVPYTLPQLAQGASDIVIGTVISSESHWNGEQTNIETTVMVAVEETVKGDIAGGTVSLKYRGGTVGDITQVSEDQPVLTVGDRYGLFLDQTTEAYRIYGLYQGVYPLSVADARKGDPGKVGDIPVSTLWKERVQAAVQGQGGSGPRTLAGSASPPLEVAAVPMIRTVIPSTASAGTGTEITIYGSGFGRKASRTSNADVEFLYYIDGIEMHYIYASGYPNFASNVNDIRSWNDKAIRVKVPSGICGDGYRCSAASGFVRVYTDDFSRSSMIPFTVTFGYGKANWGSQDAMYFVNNNFPGLDGATAIKNAAGTWNGAIPNSRFRIRYAGPSTLTGFGNDGTSLLFLGPADDFAGYGGVIAWTDFWTDASGTIREADTEFNPKWTWTTGTATGKANTFNVEAIALHEMGHWLFLKDLYGDLPTYSGYSGYPSDVGKAMFGWFDDFYGNKDQKILQAGDIAGIRWIYPNSPVPVLTGISPVSALAGTQGLILELTGDGFIPNSRVRWNGVDRPTTFVSSTRLTAAISATDLAKAGTRTVTVFNPAPGGGTTAGQTFTIIPVTNPVPVLSGISPDEASEGGEAFTLTVTGSGLIPTSKVRWNGADRPTTYVSSTKVTASIPASDIATSGTRTVTVFNPAPGGGTSSGKTFTVLSVMPPPPPNAVEVTTTETATSSAYMGYSGTYFQQAQSMKAADAGLYTVRVALARKGYPTQDIHFHLRATLNGPDLAWATITDEFIGSADYTQPSWVTIIFPRVNFLTPGNTYYYVFKADEYNLQNYYLVPINGNNPYPDGAHYKNSVGSLNANYDMLMKVTFASYQSGSAVQEVGDGSSLRTVEASVTRG